MLYSAYEEYAHCQNVSSDCITIKVDVVNIAHYFDWTGHLTTDHERGFYCIPRKFVMLMDA